VKLLLFVDFDLDKLHDSIGSKTALPTNSQHTAKRICGSLLVCKIYKSRSKIII
jgi:hypothetical protein